MAPLKQCRPQNLLVLLAMVVGLASLVASVPQHFDGNGSASSSSSSSSSSSQSSEGNGKELEGFGGTQDVSRKGQLHDQHASIRTSRFRPVGSATRFISSTNAVPTQMNQGRLLQAVPTSIDVDALTTGFDDLFKKVEELAPNSTQEISALTTKLPLFGQSFESLIGDGEGLADLLNLSGFANYYKEEAGTDIVLLADLEEELTAYLTAYLFRNALEPLLKTDDACQDATEPVSVGLTFPALTITFCADLTYMRSTNIDASGLLDAVDGFVQVETAASGTEVTAALSFGAVLQVDLSDVEQVWVSVDPLFGSLNVDADIAMVVALGMADLQTQATVVADATVKLEVCSDDDDLNKVPGVDLCLDRRASFSLTGGISVVPDTFPGLEELLQDLGVIVTISETDIFGLDPDPQVSFEPDIPEINLLKSLKDFSPSNAVDLLRVVDAAIVRAQENAALNVNLPLTTKKFSDLLATGSILTKKLLKYFVMPEPFDDRPQKSLVLAASESFPESTELDFSSNPKQLRLFLFRGGSQTLKVNPENFVGLEKDTGVTKCGFTLNETPASAAQFASQLMDGINDPNGCNTIKACAHDGSCGTLPDFEGCDCDVVVGVGSGDDDQKVFIATVAFADNNQESPKDVHLMGLYDDPFTPLTGPGELFKFPLNQPVNPGLIPLFRNFKDFTDRMAMVVESEFENVQLGFEYKPDLDPPRFEVDLGFETALTQSTSLDASYDIGDMVSIQVEDSSFGVSGSASMGANFGVILGPEESEQLVLIGNACNGDGFSNCTIPNTPFTVKLEYVQNDEYKFLELDLSATDSPEPFETLKAALEDPAALGNDVSVTKAGKSLLVVKFASSISEYMLTVPKNCKKAPAEEDDDFTQLNTLVCLREETGFPVPNFFNFKDEAVTKKNFQLAVGEVYIQGDLTVMGNADIAANVGGIIEVSTSLDASLTGSVEVSAGVGFIPFGDWLAALTKVFSPDGTVGKLPGFLDASATFTGSFTGMIQAAPPFAFAKVDASGEFTEPLEIDFLDADASELRPNIDFEVSLPSIGNLRNLSFDDILGLLKDAISFLIGDPELHSVETCSGGLLGITGPLGSSVLTYPLPVVGVSVCESVSFLQVIVDAVAEIDSGESATISALETKLKSLLEDGLGGQPIVNIRSSEDGVFSDLEIDLILKWDFKKTKALGIDLGMLLSDVDIPGVDPFKEALLPSGGEADIELGGELAVTLSLGIEYNADPTGPFITPYIVGSTGLVASFYSGGGVTFKAALGPLTGSVNADFEAGTEDSPLKLQIGLKDDSTRYYLSDPQVGSIMRDGFVYPSNILDEIESSFQGGASATIGATVPLINAVAEFEISIEDINDVFTAVGDAIDVQVLELSVGISEPPSFLDILLSDPSAIVEALDLVLETVESASLGPSGIVTQFRVPYVSGGIRDSLGAGTPDNELANVRRTVVPLMQETLKSYEPDETRTVADLLGAVVTDVLQDLELMSDDVAVTVECFRYDDTERTQVKLESCLDDDASSVQWTVPIGQSYEKEIPLDFSTGDQFPLEISSEATEGVDEVPKVEISWGFDLAFGFDDRSGFFLSTAQQDEFKVVALLDVPSREFNANLLFLEASLKGVCLQVGAAVNVDINKASALRLGEAGEEKGRNFERLTAADMGKIVSVSELFEITAIAGAALEIGDDSEIGFGGDGFEKVEDWIPKLKLGVAVQLREVVSFGGSSTGRRRLSSTDGHKSLVNEDAFAHVIHPPEGSIHRRLYDTNHSAVPLLRSTARSLGSLGGEAGDIINTEFQFDACPVDVTVDDNACAKVSNIRLDIESIRELLLPIIREFVNDDEDGYLDQVVVPVLFLDATIEPLKSLTGQEWTILDIAEIYFGKEKSGADTVRKIIEIYRGIQTFVSGLENADGIVLAEECDILDGFKCIGGLSGDGSEDDGDDGRRLREMESVFVPVDRAGLPMTLASSVNHRDLMSCDSLDCSGLMGFQKAKCGKEVLKCKGESIDGLRFPPLSDPLSLLKLLKKEDISLVSFEAPTVTFAFEYKLILTLYAPPVVSLELGFEFTAELKVGLELDTKGIREAFEQNCPLKALNSFALRDTFDDVDLPMIKLTGSINLGVSVSAVIVKVSVYGGVTFIVTIDLYDPYPEESRGLVRPFELLAIGSSPLEWFEFGVEIYVSFGVSIEIGIFLGPFEITLYRYSYEVQLELLSRLWTPDEPKGIATLNEATGDLELVSERSPFLCTKLSGSLGSEEVECLADNDDCAKRIIKTFKPVKTISTDGDLSFCELQGIESATMLKNVGGLVLNYSGKQYTKIVISENEVLAGPTAVVKFDSLNDGRILLPSSPEVSTLVTTFKDCNNKWTLEGHTNILIKGSEILDDCEIIANGGDSNTARIIVDYSDLADDCTDDANAVLLKAENEKVITEIANKHGTVSVIASSKYVSVEIRMSQCEDNVVVENSLPSPGYVSIDGRGGSDSIFIGTAAGNLNGLDDIHKHVIVDGGAGEDVLMVVDTRSPKDKLSGSMSSYSITGLLGPYLNETISYKGFEEVVVELSKGINVFEVTSTQKGAKTYINAQDKNDIITVFDTQGDIEITGGGGADTFFVYGMGDNTKAEIFGEHGNDVLWVDGTFGSQEDAEFPTNALDLTRIRWSGGDDDDTINAVFASNGTSNIDLFDDTDGVNLLNIACTDFVCNVLSRENFIANVHNMSDPNSSTERINIDRIVDETEETGWLPSVDVDSTFVQLNDGLNKVFFDDTFGTIDVAGGPKRDEFRVGQLYNSERDELHNVQVADPIETTLTTQGYLSNGCSHPITLNGNFGNDLFDVLRNKQVVDLNGQAGNDTFVVRSFIALVIENGEIVGSDSKGVKATGGDDDDNFDIKAGGQNSEMTEAEPFKVKGEDPDYVVNSLVDIDGGTGSDTLFVSGTEEDDSYVVTDKAVVGGGLSINFANIQNLQVDCKEGNDLVSVLSTSPALSTVLYGNLGSDTFNITPREVAPVTSRNLRGHRGILEHDIASGDDDYNGLLVEGVAVDVLDNDGMFGWVNFVQNEAVNLLFEDDLSQTISFTVYPTTPPDGELVININAQSDSNGTGYMKLCPGPTFGCAETRSIELLFTDMTPQVVSVKYNSESLPLDISDVNLIIKSVVDTTESDAPNFERNGQSIAPVNVKLIPSKDSLQAKSITVVEPTGYTIVAEGDDGFTADYDIYLRPCTAAMRSDTLLSITQSVPGQLELSNDFITGDTWLGPNGDCKVTITVAAVDDEKQEGDHFVALGHVATSLDGGEILLSDMSILYASNVLVRIYDNDIAGVIVDESLGYTSTAEIDPNQAVQSLLADPTLFEDSYRIRLSKQPSSDVTIAVNSIATATDRETPSTQHLSRDYSERVQVEIEGGTSVERAQSITLVFTNENWDTWQTVTVAAIDDKKEEGVDLLYFPSQPSYVAYIQGPLGVVGEGSANIPNISAPLMLPYEFDEETFSPDFPLPSNGSLYAIEENQVDYLIIHNTDVRGNEPTIGTLSANQVVGMNMGTNIVIDGQAQLDGIYYDEMEVVEIYLGNGVDDLTIVGTSHAMHILHLAAGDDAVRVKDILGPVLIHGEAGSDTVTVADDDKKLDRIRALLAFDGGSEDDGVDQLVINNIGDTDTDDVLNVTRFIVEVESMNTTEALPRAPEVSYLLNFRRANVGFITLEVQDPVENVNVVSPPLPYPFADDKYDAAATLENIIQRMIIPEDKELDSCGELSTTKCTNAVKVWPVADDAFAVFFAGERLEQDMKLKLNTEALEFDEEMFLNVTNDIIQQNSDICYSSLSFLNISTGDLDYLVANVRGTSATSMTTINTQGGDDYFFISSEANENEDTARTIDHLLGWLDYVEHDLTINSAVGRHRLLMSDERSKTVKGRSSPETPMTLTNNSLTDIHPFVGDVYFNTEGNWSAGVDLWLGEGDDRLDVLSVPSNPDGAPFRTATSVHAGHGNDYITVSLDTNTHDGVVFVANGQFGDDTIDCSQSTHAVVLFGGRGNDLLKGGSGDDVIFGDLGRVHWRDYDEESEGVIVARAGGAGYGDFTDGVVRDMSESFSVFQEVGGNDEIHTGNGDNLAIGGVADDIIFGGDQRDILFGDSAIVSYFPETTFPQQLLSVNCSLGGSDLIYGGKDVDYIVGGTANDALHGNEGMDLVFGDHARIACSNTLSHKLQYATTTDHDCAGGDDTIFLGDGDDIAFGGALSDTIRGGAGQDIILGDFGEYDADTEFLPYQNYRPSITSPNDAGGDFLYGGADDDIIICQEGADFADGGSGNDDIIGGHSLRFGEDTGDELYGGSDDDVVLGDNGEILRIRLSEAGTYPWVHGSVWLTYPEPFSDSVVRNVTRYDDVDYVQGDDRIFGGSGNDVLHGQRGDDYLSGDDGDDECYGELGSDTVLGGEGNDILIGDIGYCVRRYHADNSPVLLTDVEGTSSAAVWKKDIVLEELGNITKAVSISKKVNTDDVTAEEITSASLVFVANAIHESGGKFVNGEGEWPTDLLLFDLVESYNDVLDGGGGFNVLIGQRGNDTLTGGDYGDLLIGDAGQNQIVQNTDLPRVYQIYRTLSAPTGSGYDDIVDLGVVFTSDFELYPNQYRFVDYLASIVDVAITANDIQEKSDLLKDVIGTSTLATSRGYCMQPTFRITSGVTSETQRLHGNDVITSGSGFSIVIGDDIRGATPVDLTQLAAVDDLRQDLDNLIVDLSVRLSTMEVDTSFFVDPTAEPYKPLTVGCDKIITDPDGQAFVTGDSLTMFGRSLLGGPLTEEQVVGIVNRLRDIEWVLLDVHFALYEIHTALLLMTTGPDQSDSQLSQYTLTLASDDITSHGDGDVVIGDSAVLFTQVDKGNEEDFEFEEFNQGMVNTLRSTLRDLSTARDDTRDAHILDDLDPSEGLSNQEENDLPLTDVPFLLTACSDTIKQTTAKNLAVGDYGLVGFISGSSTFMATDTRKDLYADSMEAIRKRPAVSSFFARLAVLKSKISFYEGRYSSQVAKDVEPSLFGDYFVGGSSDNAMLGEFLTAIGYGNAGTDRNGDDFVFDSKTRGVFDTFDNADFAQTIDGDTFIAVEGTVIDGQKGKDVCLGARRHLGGNSGNGNGNGNANGDGNGNGTPAPTTPAPTTTAPTTTPPTVPAPPSTQTPTTAAPNTAAPTTVAPGGGGGGSGCNGGGNVKVPVDSFAKELFYKHKLIRQWMSDIYNAPVAVSSFAAEGIKLPQCAVELSFIPPDILGGPEGLEGAQQQRERERVLVQVNTTTVAAAQPGGGCDHSRMRSGLLCPEAED